MSRTQEIMKLEGFRELTPVQKAVIERNDPKRDLVGISSTGSGKSHAFFIPILNEVDPDKNEVQAVISVPTRELAWQLYDRMRRLCDHFGIRIKLAVGGQDKSSVGTLVPQIVIGTPGRMKDLFLDDRLLRLDTAKTVVIDEADMTMEFGFLEDVDAILSKMDENVQVMVFSATIPQNLQPFLRKYLHNPEFIQIGSTEDYSSNVTNYLVPARHLNYEDKLLEVLPAINPYVCLIFCNTTDEAAAAAKKMREAGYDLTELHSGLESRQRMQAIREIQSQKKSWIVASDIASRGIDLEGITHVISLGFPKDQKFFTHRIGRTGRAGRDGLAISIYKPSDQPAIQSLEKKGIAFQHKDVKKGQWVDLKPMVRKRTKADPLEKEIARVVSRKDKKVKPNYKKKQREQIEQLRRKKRRQMIREDIKRQKKERAKEKQRAKRKGGQ